MNGAERDAARRRHQRERQEGRARIDQPSQRREHRPQEIEGGDQHDDAEDALGGLHPAAGLGQGHRQPGDGPERNADAGRVGRQQREPAGRVARGRDERQDARQRRPRARRGDQPGHQAHHERAGGAAAPHPRQARLQSRRQVQLERAEHRCRQRDEQQRQRNDHPRVGQVLARLLAGQAHDGAERAVQRGDAGDVAGGQQHRAAAADALLGAEDRHGDRNHRIHARGERGEEACCQGEQQGGGDASLGSFGERGGERDHRRSVYDALG